MADTTQAVLDIQFLAKRFAGVVAVADQLTELGSLDNALRERQEALAALDAKTSEGHVALEASRKAVDGEKDALATLKAESKKKALQELARVEAKAQTILRDAQDRADAMVADASARTETLKEHEKALKDKIAVYVNEALAAEEKLTQLTKSLDALKAKF